MANPRIPSFALIPGLLIAHGESPFGYAAIRTVDRDFENGIVSLTFLNVVYHGETYSVPDATMNAEEIPEIIGTHIFEGVMEMHTADFGHFINMN